MERESIGALMTTIAQISSMLDTNPNDWREHLPSARHVTASLDFVNYPAGPEEKQRQIQIIELFQRFAHIDVDSGGITDVSSWCLRQSLSLLQLYPEDVDLLRLIGQNWLLRAQPFLARIHLVDGSSSSSGGSVGETTSVSHLTRSEEERQAIRAAAEAEERLHTADYVEARGILLPAVEYLSRAVEATQSQGPLSGALLATAAEAYMSLGNVSYTRVNERYFRQALTYLRLASGQHGYNLPAHLQQYLDDYGPFDLFNEEGVPLR
ncbi:hypothetical protein K432DRAFT_396965 [Lepidopterella palustris CBS 459.81]|uniref:Uncharacterized protein n=1 Tax=Lepidopterella palustris CBS 459.81 TaxID=1314670 RepID=A0A8E2JAX4_9PEZI|nr:hypothetical protein K432DRAFT_396965 [Lepidopterella palustris CBS 459.81]